MARPTVVLAHLAGVDLFTEAQLDSVDAVATVLDRSPIAAWDDPRATRLLGRAQVILGHWGCPPIDGAVLDRAPNLGLFAYAAGTLKDVVTDAVFERGVRVTSGAPANAEPVAEYTLAAILLAGKDAFWRRDVFRDPAIRDLRRRDEVSIGNWDRTIGVVGASAVGRRVIELLRAFPRLRILLSDPFVSDDDAAALGVTKLDLDDVCAVADVLSIHAPDLPSTRGMVGTQQLARLRTGATVINTARGALVDHDALVAELEAGRLYAVLDVTDPEPLPDDHPLRSLPNVFLTPHLAGSEGTELGRLAEHATDEIRRWAAGEPARNEVTRDRLARLA
jgi:phosphoglycerate dehydrogenase-like enzyme